jgi:hypothetical protein
MNVCRVAGWMLDAPVPCRRAADGLPTHQGASASSSDLPIHSYRKNQQRRRTETVPNSLIRSFVVMLGGWVALGALQISYAETMMLLVLLVVLCRLCITPGPPGERYGQPKRRRGSDWPNPEEGDPESTAPLVIRVSM